MEAIGGLLSAFGLSASAGLNAYIPMLIVALVARYTTWIELAEPWDAMTSWWVIGALIVLSIIEFFADKAPAVNHINDAIQTFIRPAAGAVLFAASTQAVSDIHPILSLLAGLFVAGTVHTAKSVAVRPAVTATTGGAANVPVSILEDVIAVVLSILSVLLPVLIAVFLIVFTSLFVWLLWRRSRTPSRATR